MTADSTGVVTLSQAASPEQTRKQKTLQSLRALPPFSPILTRLLATLAEEDVSFAVLADLIEKDTVVAANVLHLVNSALYARSGSISSVRRAVAFLGTNKLRNAVLGMSIARVWSRVKMPPGWSMARFNMHSAAVAVLSDHLAQRVPVEYPEGAFVAGLLHDTGRLLIALAVPMEYDRIMEIYAAGGGTLVECEQQVLGFSHPELSAAAIEFWKLPEQIQLAVRDHHSPPRGFPLSRVIDAANQYINSTGVSILIGTTDSADPSIIESLGLNTSDLQALLVESRAENEAMASYFR